MLGRVFAARSLASSATAARWGQRHLAAGSSFLDRSEVEDRVLQVVKAFPKIDDAKVKSDAHFMNDLGLDSLDTVELVMAFEDEFALEIPDEDSEKIFTPQDAVTYIAAHPMAK